MSLFCGGAPSKNLTSAVGGLGGILHHLPRRFHLFVEHQISPPPPRRMRHDLDTDAIVGLVVGGPIAIAFRVAIPVRG